MFATSIENVISNLNKEYKVNLSKISGKKIIYHKRNGKSIVVIMPTSKIYGRGNGWIDFTKIQLDILRKYQTVIAVFRLANGFNYRVDMNDLFPLLSQENMMENNREGKHWKLDIWPEKIVVRKGGTTLDIKRMIINL